MASRVRLNSRGVQELLNGDVADKACRPEAEEVLSRARSSAPRETGAYADSLHIEVDKTDRRRFKVVADVPYAAAVEARTGNLARALG